MTQNTINTANLFIQLITASTIATTSGGTLPFDNTIPQNTEGTEVLTATITPTSASSTLVIRFTCEASIVTQNNLEIALFQDTTANALAAWGCRFAAGNFAPGQLNYTMTAGTTSATTFKIRVGNSTTGTCQINADETGTRLMGGVSSAWLTIEEYL